MHARSVMQKKRKKKGKAEGKEWKRYGKFDWVRHGENTEVLFTGGEGIGMYG
jgi:hypothetical protein